MRQRFFSSLLIEETLQPNWHLSALATTLVVAERAVLLYGATHAAAVENWLVVGTILSALYVARLGVRAIVRLRVEARIYEGVVRASLSDDALALHSGVLETTLFSGVEDVSNTVSVVPELVGEMLGLGIICSYLLRTWPARSSLAIVVVSALLLLLVAGMRNAALRASDRYWARYQGVLTALQDVVHGRLDLIASSAVEAHRARVRDAVAALHRAGRLRWVFDMIIGRGATAVALIAMFFATLAYGSSHLAFVQVLVIGSALPCLAGLSSNLLQLVRTRAAFTAVGELLAIGRHADGHALTVRGVVAFDDVSVSLEGRVVLASIVACFEDQSVTVIVGRNGAGKSTLLRCILGLPLPTSGALTVDAIPIDQLDLDAWRARVAYLPQTPYLPPASVRVAMQLLLPDADSTRLRQALERVGLWSILVAKSADDPLGVRVDELSAGERQRVAIARALARDAQLYVFDEPDANLDRAGVAALATILEDLSKRAAVIIAAHTPDIVAVADHVVELEDGRVVRHESPRKAAVIERLREGTPR